MKVKKTEDPRYGVRSGQKLIINTDSDGYRSFMADRENYLKMTKAVSEVDALKNQVDALTNMMKQLLSQQTNTNGSN